MKRLFKSFLDLLYPPLCLHCKDSLEEESFLLCKPCLSQMVPLNASDRCPYCFSSEFDPELQTCCASCIENPLFIDRVASVFDYEGPPATLVKRLKYAGQTYLANPSGAFLVAQLIALNWPMPDVIIPMPIAPLKKIERGFNQSLALAESMGSMIERPVNEIIKRKNGDFSQAGLGYKQRLKLNSDSFFLKSRAKLYGKTVLLVDDVMTTGTTLKCCAEVLREAFPSSIYALTLCRA